LPYAFNRTGFQALSKGYYSLLLQKCLGERPDTLDTLQRFSRKLFGEISGHAPLANERELDRQLGHQPQKASAAYGDKKAILQELPGTLGGVMVAAVHPSGWRLVVILADKPARDLKEETRQGIHQTRQELSDILMH
jgi:hypothetical protein